MIGGSRFAYLAGSVEDDHQPDTVITPGVSKATYNYFSRYNKKHELIGNPPQTRFSTARPYEEQLEVDTNFSADSDLAQMGYTDPETYNTLPDNFSSVPFAFSERDLELDEVRRALVKLLMYQIDDANSHLQTKLGHPVLRHGFNAWKAVQMIVGQVSNPEAPRLKTRIERTNRHSISSSSLVVEGSQQLAEMKVSRTWLRYAERALKCVSDKQFLTHNTAQDMLIMAYMGILPEHVFSTSESDREKAGVYPNVCRPFLLDLKSQGLDPYTVRSVYGVVHGVFNFGSLNRTDYGWAVIPNSSDPFYFMDFRCYSKEQEIAATEAIENLLGIPLVDERGPQSAQVHISCSPVVVFESCANTYVYKEIKNKNRINQHDRKLVKPRIVHASYASDGITSYYLRHRVVVRFDPKRKSGQALLLEYKKGAKIVPYAEALQILSNE